jgi:MurNAc alpha-1-phosphate uridylyltransferase
MKAMIFAAGRGERMRPLTDACPKPLLQVGGKPLIVHQIEALAAAGIHEIVINHAWLGAQIEDALGSGERWGVHLHYSPETEALETAGGIVQALPLLRENCAARPSHHVQRVSGAEPSRADIIVAVSGDIYSAYDYQQLATPAARLAASPTPGMHLVMVPNPPFHPNGDFILADNGQLMRDGAGERLTFGNIGLYDLRLFDGIAPGTRMAMSPLYRSCIESGHATGERYDGVWENIGTPEQLTSLDQRLRAAASAR